MIASFSKWLTGEPSRSSGLLLLASAEIYFCDDSRLDCTLLVMPDDAPLAIPARMLPELHEHNRAFWTGGAEGRLMIDRCAQCGLWVSPPAADCPECGGVLAPQPVSGHGTVFTYTVNYQPFNPAVPVPYVIAIVQLDEQPDLRIASNIVDCEPDSVFIGLSVDVRFERHDVEGENVFVPVFAPHPAREVSSSD
jgi:uncharacterized protein